MATELEEKVESKAASTDNKKNKKGKVNVAGLAGKKNFIFIGILVICCLFVVFQFFFAPKYQLLYSELEQSDAAAISAYLQKNNIKFKISPEGDQISIAGTSVAKLRLDLANKGLPKGSGVGFEIFDKNNINISDFSQKVNYKRALEGELARTISSLDSIKSAKVHLALPTKSVFKDQNEEAKASVILVTEFGTKLTDEQVKGIQHLVSSSIQDLKPQNVQITDQDGNSLVKFNDPNSLEQEKLSQNDKKVKDYETKLESDLVEMLTPILGKGNVLVNVSAEMNFDEAEMNIEMYNPNDEFGNKTQPTVRSEKVTAEKYSKSKEKNPGTAGTQNRVPLYVQENTNKADKKDDKDYQKEERTINFEISKSVQRIKKATGLVKKISVAVVVNKDLNTSERSTLRQTVQVAAGLDMDRGDQVIVTGIKFSSTPYSDFSDQESKKVMEDSDKQGRIKKYLSLVVIIAVCLLVTMIVMFSMSSNLDSKSTSELDELLKEEDIPLLSTIDEKIQEAEEAYSRQISLEGSRSVLSMKQGLTQMAMQDPKTMARSLQAYIQD